MALIWIATCAWGGCAFAFYLAAESAHEMRHGKLLAYVKLAAAALLFLVSGYLLLNHLPPEGFARVFTVVVATLTGLACFWFGQKHFNHRHYTSSLLCAVLGLTMFASAFFTQFGDFERLRHTDTSAVDQELDPTQRINQEIARLAESKNALEKRLLSGIPDFHRKLQQDAAQVKKEMDSAGPDAKARLSDELTEIARLLLATDVEKKQTRDLLSRIRQEQRRLERLLSSQETLVDDEALHTQLDAMWAEAGTRLSRPLDDRLGTGSIADSAVQQKLDELLSNNPSH